ncbi:MAG TPA: glycine zipper 2TM domain-containing protein [Rudaea sp.]|jgi:uncharacterized protein YcfJ
MSPRQRFPVARLACCSFVTILIAACGNQSSNAPPPNSASAAPPPAATAPPPTQPAPADARENASVAELLSGSNTAATATTPSTAPAAQVAGGSAHPASPGEAPNPAAADATGAVEYARVVSVKQIPGPRQICTEQTVVERRRPEDKHRVAGIVIGALAGGLIGHQIGGGRGRTVATVGGTVAGGAIGRKVQGNHQRRDTVTRVVKHCRPATGAESEGATLYDVIYAYQGQNLHVRLDYDPGDRVELPVRGVD